MARFKITSEHTSSAAFEKVRTFCKGKGIRVTKTAMDEIFTGLAHITISCPDKRGANKVQNFIWDEVNGGAYCSITRLK